MRKNFVLTLTGPDRIGIVEAVTRVLLEHNGNVETSRMARLGGEFAMLMQVSVPAEQLADLEKGVESFVAQGYKVTTTRSEQTHAEQVAGWLPYEIEVYGADHEGIVHQVARYLSQRGINIETMDTTIQRAPMSGAPLFSMKAVVAVPSTLQGKELRDALEDVGDQLNVDIDVSLVTR